MWLKKLRLLKFNKKVAATPLAETFGYFKPEVLAKEKQRVSGEAHLLPQTVIRKQCWVQNMLL